MKLVLLATLFQLLLFQTCFHSVVSQEICDGHRYYNTCAMCKYIKICLGSATEHRYCPSLDPNKPYCNQGKCSEVPDFSIGDCYPWTIYCTGTGIFPDPDVCSMYHNCTSPELFSTVHQCPEGEVFDPEALTCKQQADPDDCMKVKCNIDEMYSRYGTSKQFYGSCDFINGEAALYSDKRIYKCPDDTSFNGKICSFECPGVGRYADSANPNSYYECYGQGEEAISMNCPAGKVFDASSSACRATVA